MSRDVGRDAHNEPRTDFIAGPPQALQRIHPLRERVSGMQGSVQGCIRRFMLQKEAGCARLLPQRVRSSGLLSDTQGNGHGGTVCGEHPHMGDTLRLIMDLAGLQDESVPRRKPRPAPPPRQFEPRQDGNVSGTDSPNAGRSIGSSVRNGSRIRSASDKDMLSLFPGPHLVGALTQSLVRRFEKQFQNIVPLHTLSPAFNPSFNTRSCGKGDRAKHPAHGLHTVLTNNFKCC